MELEVGKVYRAKKPRPVGLFPSYVNDRQIIWRDQYRVQYDGPSVHIGSHYKTISVEDFLKWASRDVTDEMPESGEWVRWENRIR